MIFHSVFADLDPPWRLPGSLPGHLLVSNLVGEKHSISRVLRHSTFGTEGLQAILKGANRKKPFNFQLIQVFARCCPGVSRQKKGAEAPRFNLEIGSLSRSHKESLPGVVPGRPGLSRFGSSQPCYR